MKYWGMKTFKQWAGDFFTEGYIGIDEEGIDKDFRTLSQEEIGELVDEEWISSVKIRSFKQFVYDMKTGDTVVIGVGKMTKFNVYGIFRIISDYQFVTGECPRHIRKVEILNLFETPVPYNDFNRMGRIEFLSEYDWNEMISSIYKS